MARQRSALLDRNRLDFLIEMAGIARFLCVHVRAVAETVAFLAGDPVAAAQLLGRVGHRQLCARVIQAHQERILQVRAGSKSFGIDGTVLLHGSSPPFCRA